MRRLPILLGLFILLLPFQTKAIICSNEDKVKYQTLASNITTSYTYTEENGRISFQITLSNIPEGFIIKDTKNNKTYNYQGNEITIYNLRSNTSYRFDVYTNDIYCNNELLYSHYVTTPPYNPFYQDEVCIGMEDNALCQKFTNMTLSYNEFKEKVNSLKNITEKPIEKEKKEENIKGIYDYILKFYLDYYYIVLPIFIIGGIIIIYRYNKKSSLF